MITPRAWDEMQRRLPVLSAAQRAALEASIREHGKVVYPVLVLPDGRIIDGANRFSIAPELCELRVMSLDDEAALALGIALNLARRQMTAEQIREVRERLAAEKDLQRRTAMEMRRQGETQEQTAAKLGVSQKTIDNWEDSERNSSPTIPFVPDVPDCRVTVPRAEHDAIAGRAIAGESHAAIAADYGVTAQRIGQIVQQVTARNTPVQVVGVPPEFPQKHYRCLVIDPPWPVKKIEREERPVQGDKLDYAVQSLDEIAALPVSQLADPRGCHVYLWVTQKYLRDGLAIFDSWGVTYQCLMTWVKPTGMTPYSWMYNTEHVLFGRVGSLDLVRKGIKLSFEAPVTRHSAKPDLFFDLVSRASPGPRLSLYERVEREGFEAWGHEVRNG